MTSKLPRPEDYSEPDMGTNLYCTNHVDGESCHYSGMGVRRLEPYEELRVKYGKCLSWLCPECFEKLILGNKEKVTFT
jgi:hypothetical protein